MVGDIEWGKQPDQGTECLGAGKGLGRTKAKGPVKPSSDDIRSWAGDPQKLAARKTLWLVTRIGCFPSLKLSGRQPKDGKERWVGDYPGRMRSKDWGHSRRMSLGSDFTTSFNQSGRTFLISRTGTGCGARYCAKVTIDMTLIYAAYGFREEWAQGAQGLERIVSQEFSSRKREPQTGAPNNEDE